jgi:hypothetical protein
MSVERYLGLPFQTIQLPDAQRIIRLQNVYGSGDAWPSLALANHNVFRLDRDSNVVWQVQRDERGHVDWEVRNMHATAQNPTAEGYMDPFSSLDMDESQAKNPEPRGVYRAGCKVYLTTRW